MTRDRRGLRRNRSQAQHPESRRLAYLPVYRLFQCYLEAMTGPHIGGSLTLT